MKYYYFSLIFILLACGKKNISEYQFSPFYVDSGSQFIYPQDPSFDLGFNIELSNPESGYTIALSKMKTKPLLRHSLDLFYFNNQLNEKNLSLIPHEIGHEVVWDEKNMPSEWINLTQRMDQGSKDFKLSILNSTNEQFNWKIISTPHSLNLSPEQYLSKRTWDQMFKGKNSFMISGLHKDIHLLKRQQLRIIYSSPSESKVLYVAPFSMSENLIPEDILNDPNLVIIHPKTLDAGQTVVYYIPSLTPSFSPLNLDYKITLDRFKRNETFIPQSLHSVLIEIKIPKMEQYIFSEEQKKHYIHNNNELVAICFGRFRKVVSTEYLNFNPHSFEYLDFMKLGNVNFSSYLNSDIKTEEFTDHLRLTFVIKPLLTNSALTFKPWESYEIKILNFYEHVNCPTMTQYLSKDQQVIYKDFNWDIKWSLLKLPDLQAE